MASTTVDPAAVTLEVLNQFSNYKRWSLAVENYLVAEDLWDVVTNTREVPINPNEAELKAWNKSNARDNARALRIIQNCCGAYNFNFIRETRSAKEAWEILKKMFEPVYSDISVKPKTCRVRPAITEDQMMVGSAPHELVRARPAITEDQMMVGSAPHESVRVRSDIFSEQMMVGSAPHAITEDQMMLGFAPPELVRVDQMIPCSAAPPDELVRVDQMMPCSGKEKKIVEESEGNQGLASPSWQRNELFLINNGGEGYSDIAMDLDREKEEIEDTTDNANKFVYLEEFFNDVESCNWPAVMEFLKNNRSAVGKEIPKLRYSVLHHAVLNPNDTDIVNNLVDLMNEDEMKMTDKDGCTALHYAVKEDNINIEMIICMVTKCKKLTSIGDSDGRLPVLVAYSWDKFEIARYLYRKTPIKALKSRNGAELISHSFNKKGPKETEIAWHLIEHCPGLVVATNYFGNSPLNVLAGMRCAFLSGKQLKFWEKWVYDCMYIEPFNVPMHLGEILIHNRPTNEENSRTIRSRKVMCSFRKLLTSFLKLWSSGKSIYEMKSHHVQSLEFLRKMSEVTQKELSEMQLRFVQSAIFRAVERGHIEFVTHMLEKDPDIAIMKDANGMNMFQYAVECRQEKIYSLIYGFSKEKRIHFVEGCVDKLNNSLLHVVGRLPPYPQLDRIQDAALRMQRELQWFEEVESIVPRTPGDFPNITDNMTAHELFKKNHKELMKEAEKSMKGTAASCTVVGSLIITMMFAAAFTVPGGNNGDTGIPLFLYEKWFMVFIASDAISLCSSTTSVIIFLGILTSRFAEVDFLKSLPTKMICGLLTLLVSIVTMMIAFYTAVYIMLKGRTSGTGISVILLGCIPIVTFIWMQFRLLKEMVVSTYGAGIFQKEVKPRRA